MGHRESGGIKEALDIEGRLVRHPYGLLAGALGLGFILGGGLFTRLSAGIVGAGLRLGLMAALPLLQDEIVRVVESAITHSKPDTKSDTRKGEAT